MPNSGAITEVVDPISNKQVADLEKALISLETQFVATAKQADALVKATGGAVSFSQFTKAAKESDAATKQIIDNSEKIKASEIRLQAKRDEIAAKQEAIAAKRRRVVSENTAAELAAAQKAIATQNAMTTAVNENDIAQGRAAARAAAYKTQTQQVGAAKAITTAEISAETAAIETNTAVQASGLAKIGGQLTKGLGYLRTLAYILPGIGIAGIFTLAFGAISSAVEALGIFNSETGKTESILKSYNDVQKEASKQYGEQSTKLQILYKAATDVTNNMHDRLDAAKALQKEFPETFANIKTETILNGGASASYQQLTKDILQNALAKAVYEKVAKLAGQRAEEDIKQAKIQVALGQELAQSARDVASGAIAGIPGEGGEGILAGDNEDKARKRAAAATKLSNERKKSLQDNIDFLIKLAGGNNAIADAIDGSDKPQKAKAADNRKQQYEEQLKALKLQEDAVLESEKSTYEERLAAVDRYYIAAYDLTKKYSNLGVLTQAEASNKFAEVDLDRNKARLKIRETAEKELLNLLKEGAKQQTELERQQVDDFRDEQNQRLLVLEKSKSEYLTSLTDQYAKGTITVAEYNNKVAQAEYATAVNRVQIEIDTQKKIIALQEYYLAFGIGTDKELQQSQDQLTKFEIEASALKTKKQLDDINTLKQARKDLANLEKDIANQSIELIKTLVDAGYTRQLDALSEQSDAIQKNADAEKKAVDRSLLSTQEKADKNAIIDAKAAAQQDAIAQKEKKIKHDQAVFDRVIAVAKIIQATALAEVQALTYLSNPITAFLYPAIAATIAGSGALELATVLATPLPKFKDGGTMKKTGLAAFGHGTELRIDPDGTQSLTPPTETIGMVKAGTKFISNKDLVNMIARPEKINFTGGQVDDRLLDEMRKVNSHMAKAKPVHGTILTSKGVKGYVTNTEKWNNYVRRNIN
jgi:hypothetical protein